MQFTTATVLSLLSALAMAAPAAVEEAVVSKAADVAQWTIQDFGRICDYPTLSLCGWGFAINTNDGTPKTSCNFATVAENGTTADKTPQRGTKCGVFTVTSAWSGQFGDGNGFTTLSVINYDAGLIAFPAYTDKQLNAGVVKPDQSYPVQKL